MFSGDASLQSLHTTNFLLDVVPENSLMLTGRPWRGHFRQSTASNVLQRLCKLGYNIAIMRVGAYPNEDNSPDAFEQGSSIICVLSYDQAQDILLGIDLHRIGAFANGKCSCKSKSHVLSNFKLRPHGIAGC